MTFFSSVFFINFIIYILSQIIVNYYKVSHNLSCIIKSSIKWRLPYQFFITANHMIVIILFIRKKLSPLLLLH